MGKNELAVTRQQALEELRKMETPVGNIILDYVQDIEKKNIAVLGTDEAFVLRSESGEIKAFKKSLTLSKQEGTLIQPVYNGDFVVSAQGYEVWAEATGTSVVFPKEVLVGNEWKPNPYAERDETNRRILAVHACAIAFRYSSMGIPQVSSWTTIFDTPSYRMIDLLAKAKKFPQAFKVLPKKMEPIVTEKEKDKTWAHYPFDESMNLWIDTSHDEVITWLSQILNREKKAMDFAQTFAKRNAIKHLSGIQKAPEEIKKNPSIPWQFPVLAWRPTGNNIIKWDATQYSDLQDRVSGMVGGDSSGEFQHKIELKTGSERVSEEENFEALESDIDPEDSPESESNETPQKEDVKKGDEKKPDQKPKEHSKEVKQVMFLANEFPDEYIEACELFGIDLMPNQLSDISAIKICKKVSELVDKQN